MWVGGAVASSRCPDRLCPATRHGSGTASRVCLEARDAYIITATCHSAKCDLATGLQRPFLQVISRSAAFISIIWMLEMSMLMRFL
jgi:hypothetical protein